MMQARKRMGQKGEPLPKQPALFTESMIDSVSHTRRCDLIAEILLFLIIIEFTFLYK
jgi:hypothetical protein